jgi:hypothetical protein
MPSGPDPDPDRGVDLGVDPGADRGVDPGDSYWVRWHAPYENPTSGLSERLRHVQSAVAEALSGQPPGPISVISMCAGQGRDVIDVVARHERSADVRALLVEQDPALVEFARARAESAGVGDRVSVKEGDASLARHYAAFLPADLVLICGVFGNISPDDVAATVAVMPSFCSEGGSVIWTRHRRPPDLTPAIRGWFGAAGFSERSFVAPQGFVLAVGRHQLVGAPVATGSAPTGSTPTGSTPTGLAPSDPLDVSETPSITKGLLERVRPAAAPAPPAVFDLDRRLFKFTGDGGRPA